jgi:hypothetical protein
MLIKSKGNKDKKPWMHPSRKKILDVMNGRDNGNATVGWTGGPKEKREVGDTWIDADGKEWEQHDGFISRVTQMDSVRNYIQSLDQCKNEKCETGKLSGNNLIYARKTGYCINCLAEKEHQFRVKGLWNDYETWKMTANQLAYVKDMLARFIQARRDVETQPQFIQADGSIEKWSFDGDIEQVKKNIEADIEEAVSEIEKLETETKTNFEKIKQVYNEIFEL